MRGIKWLAVVVAVAGLGLTTVTAEAGINGPVVPPDCPPAGTDVVQLTATADDVILDLSPQDGTPETSAGPVTFTGPATITRGECELQIEGGVTIETEIVSMQLCGVVMGNGVCMRAGTQQGVQTPSLGKIQQLLIVENIDNNNNLLPAYSFFDVFFELDNQIFPNLGNCGAAARFEAIINAIPALAVPYTLTGGGDLDMCNPPTKRVTVKSPQATASQAPVGGMVETFTDSARPGAAVDSSSGSGFKYAALGGALAAAAIMAVAGGWYFGRRRLP